MGRLIKVDDLKKITRLCLVSGFLKNIKPLSLFVVGKTGTGKTEIISSFKSSRGLLVTDISAFGLLKILKEDTRLKHIIIPDFIKITRKKRSTSDNLISMLNALTEEGIGKIDVYNYSEDFKGRQCGIIISTTKASLSRHYSDWLHIGFVGRMLFCSYSYSDETTKEILEMINEEDNLDTKPEKLRFRITEVTSTKKLNQQLNPYVKKKFRTLKQLQTLAKCNALLRESNKVEQQDIDEIIRLLKYLNLDYTKI